MPHIRCSPFDYDVTFSRPLKQAWLDILLSWGSSTGRRLATLPKYQFLTLFIILSEAIKPNCVKNLESGFRTCGIYPLNPQPSLLKLATKEIIPEKPLWQRSQGLWWESVIEMLEKLRHDPVNTKSARKKKINFPLAGAFQWMAYHLNLSL